MKENMRFYQFKYLGLGMFLLLLICGGGIQEIKAQRFSVKANALSWLTLTPSLEGEVKLADKFTADLNLMYRPWHVASDNKKVTGLAVQPEIRYWFCQTFYKHFIGLHGNYADYNGGLKAHRYQGNLWGAGITYGYQMILAPRWNLEFNVGAGYARMSHDKYERRTCGPFLGHEKKNYWGLTKLGVTVVYLIK